MSEEHRKQKKKCYSSPEKSSGNNDEEEPDFETEENLEAHRMPNSAIMDEQDEEDV